MLVYKDEVHVLLMTISMSHWLYSLSGGEDGEIRSDKAMEPKELKTSRPAYQDLSEARLGLDLDDAA